MLDCVWQVPERRKHRGHQGSRVRCFYFYFDSNEQLEHFRSGAEHLWLFRSSPLPEA
jgi:hypothetical protein